MANTKDIRAKIASTIKTQQTTKAMKMVSAAKLRRAQQAIVNARPYAKKLGGVIAKLARSGQIEHPLLGKNNHPGRLLLVVMTSDRGLCGGFNANIIRYTKQFYEENKERYEKIDFIFIGRRGFDFFTKKMGIQAVDSMLGLAVTANYGLATEVSERLLNSFLSGEYGEIRLIYNEFKSALSQTVVDEKLVPVEPADLPQASKEAPLFSQDFLFEPAAEKIMDQLLSKHFGIQVYRCMQESVASEHGARMNAMESATKNAGELISSLTLAYNKIRQAAITTELIEITSGSEALKG